MGHLLLIAFVTAVALHECSSLRTFLASKGKDPSSCQKQRHIGPRGKIASPGYPVSYATQTSCSWYIIGRVGQVVTISFDDLDIGDFDGCNEGPLCCLRAWVKLGPTEDGKERIYCGRTVPEPFLSSTSEVWIKFHSSSVGTPHGRGFQLSYTVGDFSQPTCKQDEFQCVNGKCILQKWACNGRSECEDGTDEVFCTCPEGMLRCATSSQCYKRSGRCNGHTDCPDYSDELDCRFCGGNRTLCSPTSTTCYDPVSERCDNIFHCENGEDEQGCVTGCEHKIRCISGIGCYSSEERCNGVLHCADHSDELGCGRDKCRSERGGYLCGDGRCISEDAVCDRISDCSDGSDEYACLKNSMITAAVMGSLICGLLVVVAVSCSCRLYALRLAVRRQEAAAAAAEARLDIPPRFVDDGGDFWFREPPPPYAVAVGEPRYRTYPESVMYSGTTSNIPRRSRRIRRHRRRPLSPPSPSSSPQRTQLESEETPYASLPSMGIVLAVPREVVVHSSHNRPKDCPSTTALREDGVDEVQPVAMNAGMTVTTGTAVSCDDTLPLIEEDDTVN
ncbi:low-density lipoprotein receptor-related protein 12-like isoform X2 [Ornithodoros turicata]|uniref:Putative low-density lipoprotein receptor-related protein 12 n=1 Tax=Ornithodoros turicata TaxID=34597 RepID=A0A2R5LA92_9ACAR